MKGIALADKTCRKLCMGGVPWCPLLQTLRDKLRVLAAGGEEESGEAS